MPEENKQEEAAVPFELTDRHREILDGLKGGWQPCLQMGRFSIRHKSESYFTPDEANELLRAGLILRTKPMGFFDAVQITTEGCDAIGAPYFRNVDPKWKAAKEKVWGEKSRYNEEGGEEMTLHEHCQSAAKVITGDYQKDLRESMKARNAELEEGSRFFSSDEQIEELVEGVTSVILTQLIQDIEHLVERVAELEAGFPRTDLEDDSEDEADAMLRARGEA